jgi:hypothetical protein
VISLQVGYCWLWSLIIFLIQRSLFIPHHVGGWGGSAGGDPSLGVLGESRPPMGVRGKIPQRKNFLVNVYCNFIVNLDRSL